MNIVKLHKNEVLEILRFPLSIAVLIEHIFSTAPINVQGINYNLSDNLLYNCVNLFISGFIREQSVPIFFFISGYLYFLCKTFNSETYIRKSKNRFRTLLIPYIIWNTISIGMIVLPFIYPFSTLFPNISSEQLNISWSNIYLYYWNINSGLYPANIALWFLRDLIIISIFSPLVYILIRKIKLIYIILLFVLWITFRFQPTTQIYLIVTGLFFFSLGAYISVCKKDLMTELNRFSKISFIFYPIFSLLCIVFIEQSTLFSIFKTLSIISGLFFYYNLALWIINKFKIKADKFLTSSSFFIYVSHLLIIGYILKLLFIIIKPNIESISILLIYILALLCTLSFILLSFYLLNKYSHKLLYIFTGKSFNY